jgi:lipopolysaccharide/colanic/teichoic acid biosynthesis glycosyltransferase
METETESVERLRPRNRFAKFVSFGITDTFFSPTRYRFVVLDAIVAFCIFQFFVELSPYGRFGAWQVSSLIAGATFSLVLSLCVLGLGGFDRSKRFHYGTILRVFALATSFAMLAALTVVYFGFYESFRQRGAGAVGRLAMVYGTLGSALAVTTLHLSLAWMMRRNPYRFTILGSSPTLTEVQNFCKRSSYSSQLYVHVPWVTIFPDGVIPTVERVVAYKVGDLVLSQSASSDSWAVEFAIRALQARLLVVDEVTFYIQVMERVPVDAIDKAWVLREGIAKRNVMTVAFKRWFDIVVSCAALILLAPVFVAIGVAIKLTDRGPILFVQERQGRYFEPFRMYKFRTMRFDPRASSTDTPFTKKRDPRVTLIGRILRPLHLDELPQLLNVLKGDMSLVGPRPEAYEFAKRMSKALSLYELRYLARPGLTGYAQINQGYAMDSVEDTKLKLSYDLYYLCYHSLWVDLQIMLRTVFFLAKGAR